MTGTARGAFVLGFVFMLACGGAPEPQAPQAPSSAPPPSQPGAQQTVTADTAGPSSPDAWPFGPPQSAEEKAAQLDRLAKDPGPIKSNWTPPGRSERYGHAEGVVEAPVSAVREKLGDFMHYKDLAGPKFKSVKVVEKQTTTTDVYFNLPIMKGIVTIWYVTRFLAPRDVPGGSSVVEGTFVKGNIKGMHIALSVRQGADDKKSIVVCDLNLVLSLPAPQAAVDEELRDACGDAINSIRRTTVAAP